jgi:hypothetical protein
MVGAESGAVGYKIGEAAEKLSRRDQQDERTGDLQGHKRISAEPMIPILDGIAGFEGGHQIGSSGAKGRREAEQDRASTRNEYGEPKDALIQFEAELNGDVTGNLSIRKRFDHELDHQQAQRGARQGDNEAFGHELADEPCAAGADGEAHRDFPGAGTY